MFIPRFLVVVVLAMPFVVGGCGDSGSSDGESAKLGDKPAKQILADVVSALGKVRSYHVQGRFTDEDGPASLSGDVAATGQARLSYERGGQRFQLQVIGATTYLKANDKFWNKQAGAGAARVLADRWVKTRKRNQRELVDELLPRTLASCLSKDHGAITKKGAGTASGQKTVVLHDDGNTPGGAPGDLHVAATDRPLPLRVLQTGPSKPGKPTDPKCGDGDSETTESDISLSKFDEPVRIVAPDNAVNLDSLPQGRGETGQAS
ncbi:hypothetical protein BH20ACT17_BH20ACT17_04920 [soil metagenome]